MVPAPVVHWIPKPSFPNGVSVREQPLGSVLMALAQPLVGIAVGPSSKQVTGRDHGPLPLPLPSGEAEPEWGTEARWVFETRVCHLVGLPASRFKLLFLVPTPRL